MLYFIIGIVCKRILVNVFKMLLSLKPPVHPFKSRQHWREGKIELGLLLVVLFNMVIYACT